MSMGLMAAVEKLSRDRQTDRLFLPDAVCRLPRQAPPAFKIGVGVGTTPRYGAANQNLLEERNKQR